MKKKGCGCGAGKKKATKRSYKKKTTNKSSMKGKGVLGDIVNALTFGLVPKNLIPI